MRQGSRPPIPCRHPDAVELPHSGRGTQPQLNPQKAGYTPGAPRRQRRVTQAELLRQRNRRRLLGILGVLAVLALGTIISINLLFKVTSFRVETFDRTTPADTGISPRRRSSPPWGLSRGAACSDFPPRKRTIQLQSRFPYLDNVQVDIQLQGTVVIKVRPATERFTCMYSGGWMILSDSLKILRTRCFPARRG